MNVEKVLRLGTAVLFTGAAASVLARLPAVMNGLAALGYPPYLVWMLAPAKLAAVAALVLAPHTDLARAAYLGLAINMAGAVGSMAWSGVAAFPDVFVAPAYLALVFVAAVVHDRAVPAAPTRARGVGPIIPDRFSK